MAVPAVPTNLRHAAPATHDTVHLLWNMSSGATTYKVHRNTAPIAQPSLCSHFDTALAPSTTYGHTVTALNADGESAHSASLPVTTVAAPVNVCWAGGQVSISSGSWGPAAINGDRKGTGWGTDTGGWNDGTLDAFPDWLQVTFGGQRTIKKIDVFTLQDNYTSPSEPTSTMTFSLFGMTAFLMQYWNGTAWADIPGASVSGTDKVWNSFTFSPITTDKIRIVVLSAPSGHSRVVELEAWT